MLAESITLYVVFYGTIHNSFLGYLVSLPCIFIECIGFVWNI